jgi:hypothetical protein
MGYPIDQFGSLYGVKKGWGIYANAEYRTFPGTPWIDFGEVVWTADGDLKWLRTVGSTYVAGGTFEYYRTRYRTATNTPAALWRKNGDVFSFEVLLRFGVWSDWIAEGEHIVLVGPFAGRDLGAVYSELYGA